MVKLVLAVIPRFHSHFMSSNTIVMNNFQSLNLCLHLLLDILSHQCSGEYRHCRQLRNGKRDLYIQKRNSSERVRWKLFQFESFLSCLAPWSRYGLWKSNVRFYSEAFLSEPGFRTTGSNTRPNWQTWPCLQHNSWHWDGDYTISKNLQCLCNHFHPRSNHLLSNVKLRRNCT